MTTTRRSFLSMTAAALAVPSTALAAQSAHWQGRAMGAPARLAVAGLSPDEARPVFAALEAELERLEQIFSLFRPDSSLSWLNRSGRLVAPPSELLDVLVLSDRLYQASGGVFDPTVLPLLEAGTSGRARAKVFGLIGWDKVNIDPREISFASEGMALTLNGVAQGYINDKIAALLRAHGLNDVMLDMGELQGIGQCSLRRPWQARIFATDGAYEDHITLRNRAVSTTRPFGGLRPGRCGHVVAASGQRPYHSIVTVSAPSAAVADGLSTALALIPRNKTLGVVAQFEGARIEMIR
ncbi:FAD:protein FMN transferase [uncultured Roseovarius sp.]|uniref:FAD:protein FMN transferase n=1 Tax=uncultured Roseovarius sp. TaxID=293344 RepID=UPI000C567C0D|nr:NosX protein [Roseovarius sp.]MBD11724.1 NosX protein [Roseovarius sp.]|tara:strand:- start:2527 stop:3414 length:888 start_codon:yes stop_codon:yes gene_type:complete